MARKDPFRTLDDKVEPVTVTQVQEDAVRSVRWVIGGWRVPAERPGWLRRFIVWLVLGWKWKQQ